MPDNVAAPGNGAVVDLVELHHFNRVVPLFQATAAVKIVLPVNILAAMTKHVQLVSQAGQQMEILDKQLALSVGLGTTLEMLRHLVLPVRLDKVAPLEARVVFPAHQELILPAALAV